MKDYTIFISSSDAYSDLWPIFFDLFAEYWPEYDGIIYLNTENKYFSHDGLDIRCTNVGKLSTFGRTFRAGLDKVESPFLLLIMIDYFFMGKVDDKLLGEYFSYFKNNDLDSLCLVRNPYTDTKSLDFKELYIVNPPSKDMFSFQSAFWKKEVLFQMALPHETPWLSEWYGTLRANVMKIKLAYVNGTRVIPYLAEGALHKGKWVEPMILFLNAKTYNVDFQQRGLFVDQPTKLKARIKARYKTFIPRVMSNLDLFKRKVFSK